jgi:hypothetical protein
MAQQTLARDENVVAEATDGTRLIVYGENLPRKRDPETGESVLDVSLSELDQKQGAIEFVFDDPDAGEVRNTTEYQFVNARLAFGLWLQCGPFIQPEGSAVPREIATDGQDAITAWIYLGNGFPLKRSAVAEICDVSEQTVSDRLSRIRWRP